jgi:hypothetical protein
MENWSFRVLEGEKIYVNVKTLTCKNQIFFRTFPAPRRNYL